MVKLAKTGQKNNYQNYLKGCLDIGKEKHYCYAQSPSGKYLKVFSFENNLEGFMYCYETLEAFRNSEGLSEILLGSESTGTYGDAVVSWMLKKGINMVGVNPKHVHRMKEVVDNSPLKSDKKDPNHQILQVRGVAAELRAMGKYRDQLKTGEDRLLNQIESYLVRVFPEFVQVMKKLKLASSVYLLSEHVLPSDFVELGQEKLAAILKKASNGKLGGDRARGLMEAARKSIGITEGTSSSRLIIRGLARQVMGLRKDIKSAEKEIKGLLDQHGESAILLSMPNIGPITASKIIGQTGGLNNYTNGKQLIKLAGLNLYEISSGKHSSNKKISKRGRSDFRQILYLSAIRMVKKNGIFRTQYERYTKTMKKPQALIAVAKKIIVTLFAMVKNKQEFIPGFSK